MKLKNKMILGVLTAFLFLAVVGGATWAFLVSDEANAADNEIHPGVVSIDITDSDGSTYVPLYVQSAAPDNQQYDMGDIHVKNSGDLGGKLYMTSVKATDTLGSTATDELSKYLVVYAQDPWGGLHTVYAGSATGEVVESLPLNHQDLYRTIGVSETTTVPIYYKFVDSGAVQKIAGDSCSFSFGFTLQSGAAA